MHRPMTPIETKIICGKKIIVTQQFNEQTTVQEIRDCIHRSGGKEILQSYRILLYDPLTMDLIDLEGRLQSEPSPFGLPVMDDISSDASMLFSYVQLILVRDRSERLIDSSDTGRFPDRVDGIT